jgi:uncharacterized protein (DUF1501 family)
MQRRQLLGSLLAAPLAGVSGRLMAAPAAEGSKLLVVFLRGGYDSANLLVPHTSPFYYQSRPRIAVPKPGEANGALPLDGRWGLHPALAASVLPLYTKGQAAFLPFAGTEDLTRSHFETQDSIEHGLALGKGRDEDSGFLNRLVGVLDGAASQKAALEVSAMAFTEQLPIMLRGEAKVTNMALGAVGRPALGQLQSRVIQSMYSGTPLAATVTEGFEVRDEVQRSIQVDVDAASRNAMTAKGFEIVARRMARLMRDRFDIGFVDVGGWDTHVGQGGGTGYLANRFEELGRGLAGFTQEVGDSTWRNTVVVVISEFGRTFRENGSGGTDHGHGTVYWLLGGGLSAKVGGHVIGEQAEVSAAGLFQNRDAPVLNEYRAVLGGLFARMYGLSPAQVDQVFPGAKARNLSIV